MTRRTTRTNYFVWNFCLARRDDTGRFLLPRGSQRSERALARLGRWLRRRLRGPRFENFAERRRVGSLFYACQIPPTLLPNSSLAAEGQPKPLNQPAKHQQRQALLSAPTKSLCLEGL